MSACTVCSKKFSLKQKISGREGKCWSCLRVCCGSCTTSFDGTALGWVTPHAVCGKCASQLERQRAKLSAHVAAKSRTGGTPEWTLTQSSASGVSTTATPSISSGAVTTPPVSSPASSVPNRLLEPGASRSEARRASRVLLQTLIENYKDSGNTPVRNSASERRGEPASDESDTDDVNTPTNKGKAVSPVTSTHAPESAVDPSTPMTVTSATGRVVHLRHSEDEEQRNARVSEGILSSLDALSEASRQVGASYAAPIDVADDVILNEALVPVASSSSTQNVSSSYFDADFEKELAELNAFMISGRNNINHNNNNNDSDKEASSIKSAPTSLEPVQAARTGASEADTKFQRDLEVLDDESLMNSIASLDSVVTKDTQAAIQADPVRFENVGEALTQIASSVGSRNPEASVALHEDMIEVIGEVRREEQDAKLLSMLDGLELKIKESLANSQTPRVVRKQRAEAKFKVGQALAARNHGDGCWHPASIKETDGTTYVIQWLRSPKSSQVCKESELREFVVGSAVDAQCASADDSWLPAMVEFHTPAGEYQVRFLHDAKTQVCPVAAVRKRVGGAENSPLPVSLSPDELRARGIMCVRVILDTLNENKRSVLAKGIGDRKLLLVTAQVVRHLRVMLEEPLNQVPVFELKLGAVNSGSDDAYSKLLLSLTDSIDTLSRKFILLYKSFEVQHIPVEKLSPAVAKVQRIHIWLSNVTTRVKTL